MSQNATIQFAFAGLPADYCFTSPDRFALDIVKQLSGYVPGQYSVVIDSETEPAIADRGKLWHKLLPGGAPTGKLFKYFNGMWVSPNPIEPLAIERKWVEATPPEIWSYDGGDGNDPATTPPTDATGAMWEEDKNYAARFPLGAGTSPAPSSTLFSVGDTGGEEKHALLAAEIPKHNHKVQFIGTLASVTSTTRFGGENVGGTPDFGNSNCPVTDSFGGDGTGVTTPHNTMPLYRCGRWIMRTNRRFYSA